MKKVVRILRGLGADNGRQRGTKEVRLILARGKAEKNDLEGGVPIGGTYTRSERRRALDTGRTEEGGGKTAVGGLPRFIMGKEKCRGQERWRVRTGHAGQVTYR